ncbi:MAG: PstS family phosphate ABC transporter substrate-binding protein [Desulfomonile tiedjei]|uniref:PstS family phosphate ABC transporter substrate-binding protein n=1 Tax=Desulfomonile tiedjei TaxID=2358 RepID=A0A9D6V012_9BACT|nr:PstS family phosphate ABC transporter substrate-binding protein [Desulfomonile tiedjei]
MKERLCIFVVTSTLLVLALFTSAIGADKEIIRVRGSESMADLVDAYAKEFMERNPNVNIVVSGGSGASDAFKALLEKEAEIVMQSHDIDSPEKEAAAKKGVDMMEKIIGWGGIVIVVIPTNTINELTADQVRKIFSGQITNWKQVGGFDEPIAVVVVGEKRAGTMEFFTRDFLKGSLAANAAVKAYFRSIIPTVAESTGATGFVRIRNIVQLKEKNQESRIKIIGIKKDENSPAILPSRETVNNGTYPITRPFFLYMDGKTGTSVAGKFLDFCAGKNPRPM